MTAVNPPAPDWSSFPEDDASWLEGLDISEALQGTDMGEADWLLPSDTAPTVSTGATTATLHNLDDLDALFEGESASEFNLSDDLQMELDQWEQEALSSGTEAGEWSEIPTSLSSIAEREAQARELAAWDGKDRADQFPMQSLDQNQGNWSNDLPQWTETTSADLGNWSPAPSYLDSPDPSQLEPVSQTHFISPAISAESGFYGQDQSEFAFGGNEAVSAPQPDNYLDNFDLDAAAIELNLDIDLEDFRNTAAVHTPPLHETFTGGDLPPLPVMPSQPITDGESNWEQKQMSTGLNPDRKPFEPAPPSLICDTTATFHERNTIDIFDMDENTDWSGLLEQDTAVDKGDKNITNAPATLPPLPTPDIYKKAKAVTPPKPSAKPAQSKAIAPPPLPIAPPPPVPKQVLHQEVKQFQQLLDDSNLSAVSAQKGTQLVEQPSPPLHARATAKESDQPPAPKFTLPALPWLQIAQVAGVGVGIMALLWGGAVILDRPLTQFGLRMGWWKNASTKDLSGMDLSGGNLRGADLSRTNLKGANLEKADLSLANLAEADLTGAKLSKAVIRGTNLRGTKIGKKGTKEETKLDREAFVVWQAVNERLDGLNMSRLNLLGVNLNNASLIKANLSNSDLSFATFRGANLTGANLRGAKLESADFTDANLAGASFRDANFGKNAPISSEATTCPDRQKGPCKFEQFR
jgi:uncharacterized protein YjbI with pentapeptide repeats